MVEYLVNTKRIKSVIFRSNAHKKIVAIFRVRIISSVHIKVEHSILRAPKSTPRSQGARMVQLASARPSVCEVPSLIPGDITSFF